MDTNYHHRIVGQSTTYWTFGRKATAETFRHAFDEFSEVVHRPEIDRLLVELKMPEAFLSKEIQELFLMTGELAQKGGIVKWGVVADSAKLSALRYVVRGGIEGGRTYQFLVSDTPKEVLEWIGLPVGGVEAPPAAGRSPAKADASPPA